MSLFITVRVFPGTTIQQAVQEAIWFAQRLGVPIEINFNGVYLYIFHWSSVEEKVHEFESELKRQAEKRRNNVRRAKWEQMPKM